MNNKDNSMKNILIVEDEALIAMAEVSMLKKYGYNAFAAHNYYDAVERAANADLILMDIDLGKGEPDGVDTAREIMKHRDIPIVFLSSHTTPAIVEKAESITSYGYIVKNSGESIITTSIKMAFRLYEAHQRIKREEEDYRITLESVGDAIISTDLNGIIDKVNKVAVDLIEDDLVGKQITDVFKIVNSHTREVVENPVQKVMELGKIIGLANHTTLISRSGKEYQIADSAAPIKNSKEEIVGAILVFRDVTKEYEKDERIKKSEKKFRDLFNATNEGICIHKIVYEDDEAIDYKIIDVNPLYEKILGLKKEDVVGKLSTKAYGLDKPPYFKEYMNVVENDEVFEFETYFSPMDKTFAISVIKVDDDKFATIFRDITEELRQKKAIIESEEKYRNLVDYSPIGIFQTHSNGHVLFANPAMYHMVGTESEEEAKTYFNDLASKLYADPDRRDEFVRLLRKYGFVENFEFEAITKNQIHLWFKMNAHRGEKDDEGNFIIDGFAADVTDFKRIEKELREEKDFLEQIAETSPVGITTVDKDGNITYANKRAEEILGLVRDEITTRTYDAPLWKHIDLDGSPYPDEMQPFNIVKREMKTVFNIQQGISWPNGNVVLLSINASPIRDEDGNFNGMVASIEDITKQQKTEDGLKQSIVDKDTLMRELNHRVKNNLKMISSLISLKNSELEDINLTDISRQVDAIQIIHEKIQQTGNIESIILKDYIHDLLYAIFSSFSRGSIEIINNVKDVEIKTKDAIALGLIINEVATNAIKYGFNGEEKPQFIINMDKDEEHYKLYLENTGNKFPDIDIEKVSSLGMQLITALTHQLKGNVEVVKEPNTKFIIKFKI